MGYYFISKLINAHLKIHQFLFLLQQLSVTYSAHKYSLGYSVFKCVKDDEIKKI